MPQAIRDFTPRFHRETRSLRDWADELADAVVAVDNATSALGELIDTAPEEPATADHVRRLRWSLAHIRAQIVDMERIVVEVNETADRGRP